MKSLETNMTSGMTPSMPDKELLQFASDIGVSRMKLGPEGFEVEFFKKPQSSKASIADADADEAKDDDALIKKSGTDEVYGLSSEAIKTLLDPYHGMKS